MGVSIFSGMITTIGSSIFLFLGKILLFEKFAVIIVSTAAVSFLTSMLFFGAVMHIFGPQYNWGNLLVCQCCMAVNPLSEEKEIEEMEE
jgi:Mn2+/Fe2+ NRAMP family transporter